MAKIWKLVFKAGVPEMQYLGEESSLDTGSQKLAEGVYTTFRTYNHNQVMRLSEHFDRLENSAALLNANPYFDSSQIKTGLRKAISNFPGSDVRLRIHWALEQILPEIFILGEPFSPLPETYYEKGVAVQTLKMARENPKSKATSFISGTKEIRSKKPEGVHEYILVGNSGELLEGMTSNVFCIKDDTVSTAFDGILPGITRQLVLEAIKKLALPISPNGYPYTQIAELDEVFITSASRGVLPVNKIDNVIIGSGEPGQVTRRISACFQDCLQDELTTL